MLLPRVSPSHSSLKILPTIDECTPTSSNDVEALAARRRSAVSDDNDHDDWIANGGQVDMYWVGGPRGTSPRATRLAPPRCLPEWAA